MTIEITPTFRRTITSAHGERGADWLDTLDDVCAEVCERWQLRTGEVLATDANVVQRVQRVDGTPAVLKLSVPGASATANEVGALRALACAALVALVDHDPDRGATLLDEAVPGTSLVPLAIDDDAGATSVAAAVMGALARPTPEGASFPSVEPQSELFARATDGDLRHEAIAIGLVRDAAAGYAELVRTQTEPVLLHGDLHHGNILRHGRRWLAIDPEGLVAEREYETAALMRNPFTRFADIADLGAHLRRRASQLADELDLDRERIVRWAFGRTMVSVLWHLDAHGAVHEPWLRCATVLRP